MKDLVDFSSDGPVLSSRVLQKKESSSKTALGNVLIGPSAFIVTQNANV